MPRGRSGYHPTRETVFDLYTERDQQPAYFRAIATTASWLVLGAYILFAEVFTSEESNLRPSRGTLTTLAGILLIVGYILCMSVGFLSRSLLFIFDCVLLPLLTSSFMGIFVTVMNHALHKKFPVPTQAYIYIPLITSCLATITIGVLAAVVYRRLYQIKKLDNRRRPRAPRPARHSSGYNDASSIQELLPYDIPEDEAQRRQLLRLLLQRDHRAASPEGAASTYRIDMPAPSPDWGNENQTATYLSVPVTSRPRGASLPSPASKWNLSNLMPGRGRSPTTSTDTFKDPRERRREEIERGSLVSPPPLWAGGGTDGGREMARYA